MNENNPLKIIAIDHLEFTCDSLRSPTRALFHTLGLSVTAQHKDSSSELFSVAQVRFVLTADANDSKPARQYFKKHGEGVSKISFLVQDAQWALSQAKDRGAKVVQELKTFESPFGPVRTGMIQGFGDVLNEFVERPMELFRPWYQTVKEDPEARPLATRVARIDHLTNNVPKGEMKKWVEFYTRVFGMKVSRYFNIKGTKTGLESEVVQLDNGIVIIPINEPSEGQGKSQIQEFLELHKGPGVQHVALTTANILSTVGDLRQRGMKFLKIPSPYYRQVLKRVPQTTESLKDLEQLQLLVDGDEQGYLVQNFSETYIGPLFFEFIQRKNHTGFGEGNFQALFEAIERDQEERGIL